MMFMIRCLLCFALCITHVCAASVVDVFGTTPEKSKQIIKKYGKQIGSIEQDMTYFYNHAIETERDKKKALSLAKSRQQLLEDIKQSGDFLHVAFQTVHYENQHLYTTVEVVEKSEPERMRMVSIAAASIEQDRKHDLIEDMNDYIRLVALAFWEKKVTNKDTQCEWYHCLPSMTDPNNKLSQDKLAKEANQQRALVLHTLKHDPTEERRAAAAFLVGYFNSPQEIINILMPRLKDNSPQVRNNVLRVLGETLQKSQLNLENMTPVLALLKAPETAVRNKALLVVDALAMNNANHNTIKGYSGEQLIKILALKQPNNHEVAYGILRKISKQKFGEYDIASWDTWLKDTQVS